MAFMTAMCCARDMVDRSTLAHFRAHTSALLLLQFDASGTLLVTASVHGHTINIFQLASPSRKGERGSALHLFRLSRGVTPAVIQDIAFSCSGNWLSVSSARVSPSFCSKWLEASHAPLNVDLLIADFVFRPSHSLHVFYDKTHRAHRFIQSYCKALICLTHLTKF